MLHIMEALAKSIKKPVFFVIIGSRLVNPIMIEYSMN